MEPRRQAVPHEIALASEKFDQFCTASTFKTIIGHYRDLCELLSIKPTVFPSFYPKLKSKLRSWKAQALWAKFDKRASHKCYNRGKACPNTRVLIIGAGPCGLRSAIEAQLLGAKVVVVEKRDRITRHNVLHLWPFVIHDLRALGAKKFFGKFCAGSIDHISIRQLQCILLKVALILGVEIHEGVGFENLVVPPPEQAEEKIGWRAIISPSDHPVSQYEFDVLIGADGKRNTLDGFKRKEFRGKLAIAITANFINRHSEAEARVEEISGVAFIFNQKFFKDLHTKTRIDLENIVYYKDETHYFVMTAKKLSLIDKGVILNDFADTARLLAPENVDKDKLQDYAREAADFSTNYKLPRLEFALNGYGQPDVAMFDFTSMFAAENACRVIERQGHRLLQILVGDSLLEPFWPTGSGCARGFLSSMDACWAIRSWSSGQATPLEVLAERESIYRLLGQTTPENLQRDYASYTLDPHTRYPNLNSRSVMPGQVKSFFDSDDPTSIELHLHVPHEMPVKRRRKDSQVHPDTLLLWLKKQVALYSNVQIENMSESFKNGLALCAIIHRYRPDLIDFHSLKPENIAANNQLAFDTLERELGIPPVMTGSEMESCDIPDKLTMLSYLSQIYDTFRGEIPHIRHPKLEPEADDTSVPSRSVPMRHLTKAQKLNLLTRLTSTPPRHSAGRKRNSTERDITNSIAFGYDKKVDLVRKGRNKRRSLEKDRTSIDDELQERLEEVHKNCLERERRKRYLNEVAAQHFYKSMQMLQTNAKQDGSEPFDDYNLFIYRMTAPDFADRVKDLERKLLYPDREDRIRAEVRKAGAGEDMTGRIKTLEEKLRGTAPDKKPKDLLRAIGKIDKTDWNVQELEKKIHENKMGRGTRQEQIEKVPKWSRDQFVDKFEAVKSKLVTKDSEKASADKFADIDNNLKRIDQKLKEGTALDMGPRGSNKVSAMADKFALKPQEPDKQSIQRSNSRAALILPAQGGSEICHFCDKRVYVMERLSAEGKFFHRGCFRCEYCGTTLRLGNHTFDRDGKYGSRFYCAQHFGMPGVQGVKLGKKGENGRSIGKENIPMKTVPDSIDKASSVTPGRKFDGVDVLDQRTTPERIEFENLITSDIEEPPGEMDEDEWTDRNFGTSAAEYSSSSNSDLSESDDDGNEVFEEAVDHPLTSDETRILAENWSRKYSKNNSEKLQNGNSSIPQKVDEDDDESASLNYGESDEDLSYKEYESDVDDDSETATEGEDDIKARELRKQEVCLEQPQHISRDSDTGSDTEVQSEDTTDSDDVIENSATEIETDSEFEHDGTTLIHHSIPPIKIDDRNVTKRRGYVKVEAPIKVQAKTGHITKPMNGTVKGQPCQPAGRQGIKLQFSPLKQETESTKSVSLSNLTVGKNIINSNTKVTPINIPKPLINPRQGDYLLNRTHSTEGIASKLSLELKKKYLLGPSQMGGSVKKSGSASTIDSKLKNFVDVISEHQKLLNPAPEPSPSMQAFLQGTAHLRTSSSNGNPLSPASPTVKQLSFLPLSPQQVANLRKQKELPDDVEKFEHICSLGKNIEHTTESENNKNKLNDSLLDVNTVDNSEIPGENTVMLDIANANDKDQDKAKAHSEQETDLTDCRPRSPVHETSILVPNIPWKTNHDDQQEADSDDIESDSLSSSSCSSNTDEESEHKCETPAAVITTPRVEIHNSSGELMADDSSDIGAKAINEEINQVKEKVMDIPIKANLDSNFPANLETNEAELLQKTSSITSDRSSPSTPPSIRGDDSESLCNEGTFAAFTETELSDWAQEGVVSADDLDDAEFNIDSQFMNIRHKKSKSNRNFSRGFNTKSLPRKALGEDFEDDPGHVCGRRRKDDDAAADVLSLPAPTSLFSNFENIEFMDTGEENGSDSDEPLATANRAILKNSGYVQFVDNDDLSTPVADVSTVTQFLSSPVLPTLVVSECDEIESIHAIEILPNLEAINKELVSISGEEEESSLQPDGTTTEDTTTSEIVTIKDKLDDSSEQISDNDIFYTPKDNNEIPTGDLNVDEYKEYANQVQDFVSPFYNVRDSIDIRKSHQKNKIHQNQKNIRVQGDEHRKIILKEKPVFDVPNNIQSPTLSKKLEEISKERSKQKDLIQQLVLDKHLSQRKLSQERKNKKASLSPNSVTDPSNVISPVLQMEYPHRNLSPKVPVSVKKIEMPTVILPCSSIEEEVKQLNNRRHSIHDSKVPSTDDTPLVTKENEQFFTPFSSVKNLTRKNRPLSYHSSFRTPQKPEKFCENVRGRHYSPLPDTPLTNPEAFSLPDIRKALFLSPDAPIAPPRTKHERTKEDMTPTSYPTNDNEGLEKSSAAVKPTDASYLNSNYFGNKSVKHPQFSAENDVPTLTSPSSPTSKNVFFLKRDLGELDVDSCVHDKKKNKDSDRRRSIIQAVSDFFKKKDSAGSPSPPKTPTSNINSAKEGKFRLKFNKSKGKLAYSSCSDDSDDKNSPSKQSVSPNEDKIISRVRNENNLLCDDTAPPPIPPPPKNYLESVLSPRDGEDFHSELEEDSRITAPSTPSHETGSSVSSLNRRHSRMQLRLTRQAQQKRLRMAQEVQRQLEELEVKQKELEQRGVCIEKALRGEGSDIDGRREEADLLKEWFELVRERSELRRYERELLIRAEDLELEDRHTRLQQELREMLQKDDANKSHDDVQQEGRILEEMLEIVERRDSLIALLEEDRQRYQEEDRDLEAQMLAKGLRLTPLRKESDV